jgi:hypothetical protein
MFDRLSLYCAALVADWYGRRIDAVARLQRAVDGPTPVYVAEAGGRSVAIAIAALWEPETGPAADEARQAMEERLSEGSVRGPYLLWAPPRATVPAEEPLASDFVMRVQMAAAPLGDGARSEVDLPVKVIVGKAREEGGYASVIGGLSRWWTDITDRVKGTVNVNSMQVRRASASEARRNQLLDRIGEAARPLAVGEAVEVDAVESWTVQRLATEPLGERGWAIAQAPPDTDPADGTLVRRLVRRRLKDANAALAGVDADVKGAGLIGIYEYAEHANIGSFVKSVDPSLHIALGFVAGIVDGEVIPILAR